MVSLELLDPLVHQEKGGWQACLESQDLKDTEASLDLMELRATLVGLERKEKMALLVQ